MNKQPVKPALTREEQEKVNQLLREYSPQAVSTLVAQQTDKPNVKEYQQMTIFDLLKGA